MYYRLNYWQTSCNKGTSSFTSNTLLISYVHSLMYNLRIYIQSGRRRPVENLSGRRFRPDVFITPQSVANCLKKCDTDFIANSAVFQQESVVNFSQPSFYSRFGWLQGRKYKQKFFHYKQSSFPDKAFKRVSSILK